MELPMIAHDEADIRDFKLFIGFCQSKSIAVYATPKYKTERGYWNGYGNIYVHRPEGLEILIDSKSLAVEVDRFIAKSPNIKHELAILLHQYGHWCTEHPPRKKS